MFSCIAKIANSSGWLQYDIPSKRSMSSRKISDSVEESTDQCDQTVDLFGSAVFDWLTSSETSLSGFDYVFATANVRRSCFSR